MTNTVSAADVRALNRAAAQEFVRSRGPISRSEIADLLDLSLPAVSRIVGDLIEDGLVRTASPVSSEGRKQGQVEFNGDGHLVIGIDLGGTKIFGAVANLNGDLLYETYFGHNQSTDEESFIVLCQSIQKLVGFAQKTALPIYGIAVGVPGAVHPETGMVTYAPSLDWNGFPLKSRLSERFPYPLAIENDVNLAAPGEFWFGTEPGVENLVLLAIGTGIGAGVVINGQVHTGAHSMAGEVGYLLPDPGSLRFTYPSFGAFEQLASGTGIADRARKALQEVWAEGLLAALTAEDIFNAARAGEPWATAVLDETIDYLAQAVASISLILISGGASRSADLLIGPIQGRLSGVIPIQPKLAVSRLGYRAGILGGVAWQIRASSKYHLLQTNR